jgi:dCTP deaminase
VLEPGQPFIALPGAFFLACTQQKFNLPDNLSAEYKLRSHMARCGLNHMLAGWCDAGWHDSVLTLEFKNELQYSAIELMEGDPAGQIVCMRHLKVPPHASYASKGRFNGDHSAQPTKE